MPIKMTGGTAVDLLNMLRRHYLPEYRISEGIFAPEIGAPGTSGRRADLIWLPVASRGRKLVGHEIKVSRVDLKHELAQPEKCVPWKRYCDRWWLVVPHAELLRGFDVPEDWGIMLPPSGRRTRSMTVLREAPQLSPEPQAPAMQTLAVWLFWRHHESQVEVSAERRHNAKLLSELDRMRRAREAS